jgi:hypothetical protein
MNKSNGESNRYANFWYLTGAVTCVALGIVDGISYIENLGLAIGLSIATHNCFNNSYCLLIFVSTRLLTMTMKERISFDLFAS